MRDNSFIHSSIVGPLGAVRQMSRAAWFWATCYLLLSSTILLVSGWFLYSNHETITEWLLNLLLPNNWHFTALALLKTTFAAQSKGLLVNMAVAGGLVLVSITLFPVKEKLSEVFERDAKLSKEVAKPLPLWMEALEEMKWLLVYLTCAGALFWLGYYPGEWRDSLALCGSYLLLFVTFAVDFVSPILFRHRHRYGVIFRLLLRRPLVSLTFGATFASAPILASELFLHGRFDVIGAWPIWAPIVIVLTVEVVAIVWACIGGTLLGSQLLEEAKTYSPTHPLVSVSLWSLVALVLFSLSRLFGGAAVSLYEHSRLLRCEFSVDWSSVRPLMPSVSSLLSGEVDTGIGFNVGIYNPTDGQIRFDRGRIELLHDDVVIGDGELPRVELTPGESQTRRIEVEVVLELVDILRAEELMDMEGWSAIVHLQLADGTEFPIFL